MYPALRVHDAGLGICGEPRNAHVVVCAAKQPRQPSVVVRPEQPPDTGPLEGGAVQVAGAGDVLAIGERPSPS